MKNRLNITVDDALVEQAKRYAAKHKTSLSSLIERYLKSLTRPARKKNIIDLMKELPKPKGEIPGSNVKELYYENRKKKYGF